MTFFFFITQLFLSSAPQTKQTYFMKLLPKALFLFVASALAISCSDDPEENYTPLPTFPMVTKITTSGTQNRQYELTYDVLRRISKMTVTTGATTEYKFTYNADNLISKVVVDGATDVTYTLLYDENKIYSGFTASAGGNGPATYDEVTKTYTLSTAYGADFEVKADSDYDLTSIYDADEDTTIDMHYDSTLRGPFYNAVGNIHFVMSLFDLQCLFFATKKMPLRISSDDEPEYGTYDSDTYDSFVTETVLSSTEMDLLLNINYDYNWK